MNPRLALLTGLVAVLMLAGVALAENPAPRASGGILVAQNDPGAMQRKRARVRKHIRALRAWMLTEELDLDEVTASRLAPILSRYDSKFEAAMVERRRLRKRMRAVLDSGATDAKSNKELGNIIDGMIAQQQKVWELQKARFRDVRRVLTPRQSARIFVLLPQIDRKIRRKIRRVLRRGEADARPRRMRRGRDLRPGGGDVKPRDKKVSPSETLNPFD